MERFFKAAGAYRVGAALGVVAVLCVMSGGCGDGIRLPSAEELAAFERAESPEPRVETWHRAEEEVYAGPYRVVAGDVLEVSVSAVLQSTSVQASEASGGGGEKAFVRRVDGEGMIAVPVAGKVKVGGKSTAEIDEAIAAAYYPRYSVRRPSVYVRVAEHCRRKVTVVGDVAKPGVYGLASDEMSLVSLLAAAGGIADGGAAVVRISRAQGLSGGGTEAGRERATEDVEMSFVQKDSSGTEGRLSVRLRGEALIEEYLDVGNEVARRVFVEGLQRRGVESQAVIIVQQRMDGLSELLRGRGGQIEQRNSAGESAGEHGDEAILIVGDSARVRSRQEGRGPAVDDTAVLYVGDGGTAFADVALEAGDRVIVQELERPLFTVMGLVVRPGNFPYPRGARYNLMEAIAFAGGPDPVTEPRYATMYRLDGDGEIVSTLFRIARDKAGEGHALAMQTRVKPGDIVALEHTPRTRSNVVLNRLFRINFGVYAPIDGWDD